MTDPAVIDLEGLGSRYLIANSGDKLVIVTRLIVAVEELREQVDELLQSLSMSRGEKEALRGRVAELETALDDPALPASWHDRARAAEVRVVKLEGQIAIERGLVAAHKQAEDRAVQLAEAAGPHTAELAGALEAIIRLIPDPPSKTTPRYADRIRELARTALAATPAEALERARAKDEVLRWAKELCWDDTIHAFKELEEALAKLDALDQGEHRT